MEGFSHPLEVGLLLAGTSCRGTAVLLPRRSERRERAVLAYAARWPRTHVSPDVSVLLVRLQDEQGISRAVVR